MTRISGQSDNRNAFCHGSGLPEPHRATPEAKVAIGHETEGATHQSL
jgi:hypothetical protein